MVLCAHVSSALNSASPEYFASRYVLDCSGMQAYGANVTLGMWSTNGTQVSPLVLQSLPAQRVWLNWHLAPDSSAGHLQTGGPVPQVLQTRGALHGVLPHGTCTTFGVDLLLCFAEVGIGQGRPSQSLRKHVNPLPV